MNLTPEALTLTVPHYFKEERAKELEEREKLLSALLAQYTVKQEVPEKEKQELLQPKQTVMSLEEAIRIIQTCERGRQGRKKAREAREARNRDKEANLQAPAMEPEKAAILIQKTFRGHLTRKRTKAMREEELAFIGMKPTMRKKENDPIEKADATRTRRKLVQNQNELEYQQAIVFTKKQLTDQEGPDIKERQQDEIRKYFISHKEQIGKFPVFPNENDGGSKKMLNPLLSHLPPSSPAIIRETKKKVAPSTTTKSSLSKSGSSKKAAAKSGATNGNSKTAAAAANGNKGSTAKSASLKAPLSTAKSKNTGDHFAFDLCVYLPSFSQAQRHPFYLQFPLQLSLLTCILVRKSTSTYGQNVTRIPTLHKYARAEKNE